MDIGTATNTGASPTTPTLTRVTAIALTACVGLMVGLSTAAESADKSDRSDATVIESVNSVNLIVRTDDAVSLGHLIANIALEIPGVELSNSIDLDGQVFFVRTPNHSVAMQVSDILKESSVVRSFMLSRGTDYSSFAQEFIARREMLIANGYRGFDAYVANRAYNAATGVATVPSDQAPRGGSGDPDFASQWHFENAMNPGFDNNLPASIYLPIGSGGLGLSGAGVNIAMSTLGLNIHFDIDHPDLVTRFDPSMSMLFDPDLLPDNANLTGIAGLIVGERDNGIAGQGVSPGSTIATINWDVDLPLLEFEAYDWKNQVIDIKLFQTTLEFTFPGGTYNNGHTNDYVMDPLENSIRSGRGGLGVINIFGAGVGFNFLPNPYAFPPAAMDSFSPTDEMQASPNAIADGLTNNWVSGPYYPGGISNYYPPANDRRSLIINSVAEDGYYDSFSGTGPSIFASVFAGVPNEFFSGSQGVSGRGVLTTIPVDPMFPATFSGLLPVPGAPITDLFLTNMTGTSITGGIVSLMLEANPRLKMRDIQHIFFRSIQESLAPDSIKWPDFDATRGYYFPDSNPPERLGFWEVNGGLYTGGPVANQAIRHSDQYGFGVIDGELAISMASTWLGTPRLFLLDTGIVGDVGNGDAAEDGRVPALITDATFVIGLEADGTLGIDGAATLVSGTPAVINFCVRQNISIEAIIVDLTIDGDASNDMFIELFSPQGTRTILSMPTTRNLNGMSDSDDPNDDESPAFTSGNVGGTGYSFYQHPFLTWKHWGELSGGVWTLVVTDYGPDTQNEEGEDADPAPMGDPGADMVTTLGEIGIPGSEVRVNGDKEVQAFRVRIFGSETGSPIFQGCNPFTTSCPADVDGNGIINVADLQIYIHWWVQSNSFADMNGDGSIDYSDLALYRGIWNPGFCDATTDPFAGGRPRPGGGGGGSGGDNDPVVRPI